MQNMVKSKSTGQILVIFTIGLVVLLAVAALLVDGGQTYMNRRAAQAAADAAALAGAQELCIGAKTEAAAEATAVNYAITHNGAATATADADLTLREVDVAVTIQQPTFFASVLGFGSLSIPANAGAACLPPAGNFILPIAWACPDLITDPITGEATGCNYETLDWEDELKPLIDGQAATIDGISYGPGFDFQQTNNPASHIITGKPYIIMDSLKLTMDTLDLCLVLDDGTPNPNPNAYLDCSQISTSGSRSWLDLDGGGGGASELVDWIECDNPLTDRCDDPFQVTAHTWVMDQHGNIASLYNTMVDYDNLPSNNTMAVRFLPVYNAVCDHNPDVVNGDDCTDAAHPPDGTDRVNVGNGSNYFHLMSIAQFYVTCTDRNGGGYDCPYHRLLGIDQNGASIEGYFVENFPIPKTTVGDGNLDMGIYTFALIR